MGDAESFQDFPRNPICPLAQVSPPMTMLTLYPWDVAAAFGKLHKHVLRDIDNLIKQMPDCRSKFGSTTKLLDNSVTAVSVKLAHTE